MRSLLNSHRFRRFFLTIGAFVLVCSGVSARERDVDLNRALSRNGNFELVKYQLEKFQNDPDLRKKVPMLKGYMYEQKADQAERIGEKLNQLKQARNILSRALDKEADSGSRRKLRVEVARIWRMSARVLFDAYEEGNVKKNKLQKAVDWLDNALSRYQNLGKDGENGQGRQGLDPKEIRFQRILTHFQQLRAFDLLGKGDRILEKGKALRKMIEEYQWEYPGELQTLRLVLHKGLTELRMSWQYSRQGDSVNADSHLKKAKYAFESITAYLKKLDRFSGRIQRSLKELSLETYYKWMKALNDHKKYQRSLEILKSAQLAKKIPNWKSFQKGRGIFLEKARAQFELGRRKKAFEAVSELANYGGRYGQKAQTLRNSWEQLEGKVFGPEEWLERTTSAFVNEKYNRAIFYGRRGLEIVRDLEEQKKWQWAPDLLHKIGFSYLQNERWYEAAVVFRELYRTYGDFESQSLEKERKKQIREWVVQANFYAARSFASAKSQSSFSEDEEAFRSELEYLKTEFSDSKYRERVQMMLADSTRESGNYKQAIKNYRQVIEEENRVGVAWVNIGYSYYLWGNELFDSKRKKEGKTKYKEAEKALENYFDLLEDEEAVISSEERNYRFFAANIYSAILLHSSREDYQKANQMLRDVLAEAEDFRPSQKAELMYERYRALRSLSRFEQAEHLVKKMSEEAPESEFVRRAYLDLAKRYDPDSDKSFKGSEGVDRKKSGKFYYRWAISLMKNQNMTADTLERILAAGNKLLQFGKQLGEQDHGQEFVRKAKELFQEIEARAKRLFSNQRKRMLIRKIAETNYRLENYRQALEGYETLLDEKPDKGYYELEKARTLKELAKQSRERGSKGTMNQQFNEAYEILNSLREALAPEYELYWEVLYLMIEIEVERGNIERAESYLSMLKGDQKNFGRLKKLQKEWDSEVNWSRKFNDLEERINESSLGD